MAIKKKRATSRSAKQLANDKRLGRMAKKRAAKKRGKSRVTKKKATRRKNPREKYYKIFRSSGSYDIYFMVMRSNKIGWSLTMGEAILFATKKSAKFAAESAANLQGGNFYYGVADQKDSVKEISDALKKIRGHIVKK